MTRIPQLFTWYPFNPIIWEGGDVSFSLFGLVQGFLLVLSLVIYISCHKYTKHPRGFSWAKKCTIDLQIWLILCHNTLEQKTPVFDNHVAFHWPIRGVFSHSSSYAHYQHCYYGSTKSSSFITRDFPFHPFEIPKTPLSFAMLFK